MKNSELIAIILNIYWAISLLLIIRTVRQQSPKDYDFVKSASKGNLWFGTVEIHLGWFKELYKKYSEVKGMNILLITNLSSLILCIFLVVFIVITEFF